MNDVQKKLEEYRRKRVQPTIKMETKGEDKELKEKLLDGTDSNIVNSSEETEDEINDSINCFSLTDLLYYGLCFILWVILFDIFVKLEFGTVYFLVSGLIAMYLNTRTRPKKKGELSAYSVFNKDCISIDGTLKVEQFEREIRYGPSVIR